MLQSFRKKSPKELSTNCWLASHRKRIGEIEHIWDLSLIPQIQGDSEPGIEVHPDWSSHLREWGGISITGLPLEGNAHSDSGIFSPHIKRTHLQDVWVVSKSTVFNLIRFGELLFTATTFTACLLRLTFGRTSPEKSPFSWLPMLKSKKYCCFVSKNYQELFSFHLYQNVLFSKNSLHVLYI